MATMTIHGIDLDIDIDYRYSGFRMTAQIYDLDGWQIVQEFGGELRIMQTPYEALVDLAFNLFGVPEPAETMAELLGVPIRFYDDEEEYA